MVDDGSTDATADLVREMQVRNDSLRLIEQANRGRGAARAVGVKAAEGELIAMVDADICLPRTWLATCLSSIEEYDVVGGTAVPDGDVTYLYNTFRLTAVGAPATTTVTGNNGLYRRRVFDHVMFDEQLREGEDIDINHKLLARGYRLACLPGLQVEHHEDKSLGRSVTWLYESGRGATRQSLPLSPDPATRHRLWRCACRSGHFVACPIKVPMDRSTAAAGVPARNE